MSALERMLSHVHRLTSNVGDQWVSTLSILELMLADEKDAKAELDALRASLAMADAMAGALNAMLEHHKLCWEDSCHMRCATCGAHAGESHQDECAWLIATKAIAAYRAKSEASQ